jgi:NAD(P)-dependent dehydrogenase (short-subunit alcohol dehydrogenase family)
MNKPFAIVTGASSGIGLELAAICAQEGFDLLVAAVSSAVTQPPASRRSMPTITSDNGARSFGRRSRTVRRAPHPAA